MAFSGGGTGRDFECFQGGSGDVSVQRQPQHQNWGAGLWDGYQMDQAGLTSQSAGNKTNPSPVRSCVLQPDAAVLFNKHVYLYRGNTKSQMKTLVTTDNTDAGCLQSWAAVLRLFYQLPLSTQKTVKTKKGSLFCLGSVHQMCAALVCNPIGALPSECALFLVTVHLFVRDYEKNQQNPISACVRCARFIWS